MGVMEEGQHHGHLSEYTPCCCRCCHRSFISREGRKVCRSFSLPARGRAEVGKYSVAAEPAARKRRRQHDREEEGEQAIEEYNSDDDVEILKVTIVCMRDATTEQRAHSQQLQLTIDRFPYPLSSSSSPKATTVSPLHSDDVKLAS